MNKVRKTYYAVINSLSEAPLISNATGFGLYDRDVLSILKKIDDPYPYFRGLICEIGLKAPSKIDEKTSDVGLLDGVESSVWSSERPAAVLLGFWAAFEATSWGSR